MKFISHIKTLNAKKKIGHLLPYVQKKQTVLDFGCGDLSLAKMLFHHNPSLSITGVDVVDFGVKDTHIQTSVYDGKRLPYKNGQFDIVIAYHVLHHTDDPVRLFDECLRVCKKTFLLVEPVYRFQGEIIGMSLMDWIFNIWKEKTIAMRYLFKTETQWKRLIKGRNMHLLDIKDVELLPQWFPTGRSYLFVCEKREDVEK